MVELSCFASFTRDEPPRPWDPSDPDDRPFPDCAYLGGVFRAFEEEWSEGPLTIFLTKNPRWIPRVGEDVVVVLLADEWFRVPAYSGEVLAVVRHHAADPWFPWRSLARPSATAAIALVNHLRLLAERALYQRKSRRMAEEAGWRPMRSDNSIDIPLGYLRQPERPLRPWDERGTDVYFSGSLIHDTDRRARWKRSVKQLFGNPKLLYRKSMLRNLEGYARERPGVRTRASVSGDFHGLGRDEVDSYADDMMDARIALVPRGTAAESYRLFEAWRYGCIPICEGLPPRPFYAGAPLVELRSWSELGPALDELLADPGRQRQLHERSIAWWREVCAEAVVGRELASKLSARTRRPQPARA